MGERRVKRFWIDLYDENDEVIEGMGWNNGDLEAKDHAMEGGKNPRRGTILEHVEGFLRIHLEGKCGCVKGDDAE